jgi:hypothetical protein
MTKPVDEVDYHTPADEFRKVGDKKSFGFIRKSELPDIDDPRKIPKGFSQLTYSDILEMFSKTVQFSKVNGHVVPSHINVLTAPNLTWLLQESERKYEEQVQFAITWGTGVAKVVSFMGAAGNLRGAGAAAPTGAVRVAITRRAAMSRVVGDIELHLAGVLERGAAKTFTVEGIEFATVRAIERNGVLEVSRYSIESIGAGAGRARGVSTAFEQAAINIARSRGLKTVTINVGNIVNSKWKIFMQAMGYVSTEIKTSYGYSYPWIKTINL